MALWVIAGASVVLAAAAVVFVVYIIVDAR
jgi:hypothetical protein